MILAPFNIWDIFVCLGFIWPGIDLEILHISTFNSLGLLNTLEILLYLFSVYVYPMCYVYIDGSTNKYFMVQSEEFWSQGLGSMVPISCCLWLVEAWAPWARDFIP